MKITIVLDRLTLLLCAMFFPFVVGNAQKTRATIFSVRASLTDGSWKQIRWLSRQ